MTSKKLIHKSYIMKKIIYFSFLFFSLSLLAHTVNHKDQVLHHWYIQKENKYIDGSFHKFKNGMVSIEDENNLIIDVPLNYLSKADQSYVNKREEAIVNLNVNNSNHGNENNTFLCFVSNFSLNIKPEINFFKRTKKWDRNTK